MKTLRELREKTLTPAEKKKREEIAKAMEKDNPDMPMDKKMAIATATAKRVAEEKTVRQLIDPKKEVMVVKMMGKQHKVIVIDKSKEKEYLSKGWTLAEETQLDEDGHTDVASMKNKVKIAMSALQKMQMELSKLQDGDSLPSWWTNKVAVAVDKLDGMADYIDTQVESVELEESDATKLYSLYNKAIKMMPDSPAQKKVLAEIDKLRKKLGMDESLNEAVKTTHVVVDTADGNKVVATASDEKGAKSSIASAERPPMNIKNKKTLKIVKLKRPVGDKQVDRMVGYPLKEAVTEAKGKYASDAQMDDFLKGMEKHPDVKKMSNHYNRPVGDIVKALRARVSVNRLSGGNVYTLNFTDKDSKLKVKAKKRYAPIKEAVSPAQQAAIAISKKERGEKPKNEASAAADARRAMKSRGATKGMATTKKDKDTEATDDDRKAASKNIIMQLRKAADLPTGAEVDFNRGKGKVSRDQAKAALARFDALSKPNEKERFQKSIRSLSDIKKILGR